MSLRINPKLSITASALWNWNLTTNHMLKISLLYLFHPLLPQICAAMTCILVPTQVEGKCSFLFFFFMSDNNTTPSVPRPQSHQDQRLNEDYLNMPV